MAISAAKTKNNTSMIGIFGGTFDPVHNGHIQTVLHVLKSLNLEHIRLVPLGQAVHREQPVASSQQRLDLLKAAIQNQNGLVADGREINRPGGSYTIDTLKSLKQEFPDKSLCLIIGSDAFKSFESWKAPEQILSMSHLVVMQRPNIEIDEARTDTGSDFVSALLKTRQVYDNQALQQYSHGKILFVEVPQINISSTMIRQKLADKEAVNDLVPASVSQLIKQWHLYQDKTGVA